MTVIAEYRRAVDDGREVVVERHDDGWFFVYVDGEDPDNYVGAPDGFGSGMIAAALGYNIAQDEWPEWINRWAEEIEPGSAAEPA